MQDISLIQTLQSLVAGQHLDLAPKPSGSGLKLITAAGMVGLLVLLVSINAPQSKHTKTDKQPSATAVTTPNTNETLEPVKEPDGNAGRLMN